MQSYCAARPWQRCDYFFPASRFCLGLMEMHEILGGARLRSGLAAHEQKETDGFPP
jgi:hypothetical protein